MNCSCSDEAHNDSCGPNMHYNACGTACPSVCNGPDPATTACVAMCRSGCECDVGYVLLGSTCVLPVACPAPPAPPTPAPPVGAPQTFSPLDSNVLRAAGCVVDELNQNGASPMTLQRVLGGTEQVVSGLKYEMDVEVVSTGCTGTCATRVYAASVWLRPWLTPGCSVESISLVDTAETTIAPTAAPPAAPAMLGGAPGGRTPIDPSSSLARAAASCAVVDLNGRSNSLYQLQLVSIETGTVQVVSGARYDMTVAVGLSACANSGPLQGADACPVTASSVQSYQVPCRRLLCFLLSPLSRLCSLAFFALHSVNSFI